MKRVAFVYTFILIFSFCGKNVLAQGALDYTIRFWRFSACPGNAFVARADDASAIQFNPAGLTQLERPQIYVGGSLLYPSAEFHGNNGDDEVMHTKINTIPNFYIASPIIENKLAAGLGVTVPYGLQGKWDEDGFSRFIVTDFKLGIININPTITYKPLSCLSIGVGFDYYYANSSQESRIPFSLITSTPDGHSDLDMHGDGFGYNTGILYNITPHHSVGASFRSKADINFDGKLKQSGFPVGVFGSERFNSQATTSATIPEMLSFGYAYRHGDLWSIEADAQWTNWSRFDILNIGLEPPNPLSGAEVEDVRNWHNTWSFALGGEYALSEAIKVRGGYTFHESPVPK